MNKKIALVLAGGGALGSYEVGAIQALTELNYKFDIVTGTSIGALIGAFYVSGQQNQLKSLWENITAKKVMVGGIDFNSKLISNPTSQSKKDLLIWTKKYLDSGFKVDISPFKKYIKDNLNVDSAMNSSIKFGIVTTSFPSFKCVDVNMNNVSKTNYLPYLHASSACRPIFPEEIINGKSYIDGFFNDNLPIRLAFEYGADEIVAIDMKLFQLKPQNSFYLSLPNVTYIAPHFPIGNMMDFSYETISKNMKLGYLDTLKVLGILNGFYFSIKGNIEYHGFLSYLLQNYGTSSKIILDNLKKHMNIKNPQEIDYFLSAVELVALKLQIDNYYEIFTFDEFNALLKKAARDLLKDVRPNNFMKKVFEKLNIKIGNNSIMSDFLIDFSSSFLHLFDLKNVI